MANKVSRGLAAKLDNSLECVVEEAGDNVLVSPGGDQEPGGRSEVG